MKILITGANGFLGRHCLSKLKEDKFFNLRAAVRNNIYDNNFISDIVKVGDIDAKTEWRKALQGIDIVVHAAAMVHVMDKSTSKSIEEFRRVNVEGTINLLKQAIQADVKRFIFISTIKVNGEYTVGNPFFYDDKPSPQDSYAVSKYEAESEILRIAKDEKIRIIIIRPPLIYGKGVSGNLRNFGELINKGWPLPLGLVKNNRDLISVYNLVDLICSCFSAELNEDKIFLASDNSSLSTPQLVKHLAINKRKLTLLPIPIFFLKFFLKILGKKDFIDRLCGDMQINIDYTMQQLNWSPPYGVEESFKKMHR